MAISALPDILEEWADVIHPAALLLPRPTAIEYADLKLSVQERGVLQPLATFVDQKGDHWLLDGVSRLQIMVELGMPIINDDNQWAMPTTPFYEDKGDDPYEVALSLNIARRHLTNEQKRGVIADLMEQRPDLSDRAIARMAGSSPMTVGSVRHGLEEGEEQTENGAEEEGEGEDEAETEAEAHEESGRRARGQRRETRGEREDRTVERLSQSSDEAFTGTVLPSAHKAARIAEARRCIRHLRLEVEDLLPRSRRETMH